MEDADLDRSHKRRKSHENQYEVNMEADITDFNPDATTPDIDDTRFSDFSEMPGLDMTKFASFKKSPTKMGDVSESKLIKPNMTDVLSGDTTRAHANDSLDSPSVATYPVAHTSPLVQRQRHDKSAA